MIATFADRLRGLTGWSRLLAALALGSLSALAFPPFHAVPLLWIALPGLVWLLEGIDTGPRPFLRALFTGFWFGFGQYFVALHWIVEPMLVDPARTAWMIPFAWPGLAALLAVFTALVCAAQSWGRFGTAVISRVVALAGLWTLFEMLRGSLFTGFPWNLTGYIWAGHAAGLPVLQASAVLGVFGLGAVTVLAAAMPAVLATREMEAVRRGVLAFAVALLVPGLLWVGGAWRLAGSDGAVVEDVRLRIVQANIAQRDKWRPELRRRHLDTYIALSRSPAGAMPTHVIWPETAVPFLLANDVTARTEAARAVPPGGALVTGSVRSAFVGGQRALFNALLVIDDKADVLSVYDKAHLVPFGEYVPFRDILPVDKVVPGQGDFTPGPGPQTLAIDGLPAFSALICYEAIFPAAVVPDTPTSQRPAWLLNLTNDAWFGNFAGPRQHFAIATTRAVEEGMPMVRAANTGISAVVDPYGRVQARLGSNVRGIVDAELPAALESTLFSRWGNLIPLNLGFALVFVAMMLRRRRDTA